MISKCSVVQQVYQVGFRKSFLKPGGFACTSWAENKEAISRSVKKSFSEFVHRYPQLVATRLTLQVKIESQFYPIGLKMQAIFYLYGAGVLSGVGTKKNTRKRNFIDPSCYFRLWERFSTAIYSVMHIHYKCSFIRAMPLAPKTDSLIERETNEHRTSNIQHRTSNNVFCLF